MAFISPKRMEALATRYERLKSRTEGVRAKAEEKAQTAVTAAEIIGGAAVGQYAAHRFGGDDGHWKLFGTELPTDLVVGSLLTLTGMFELYGKPSGDIQHVGVGMVSGWVGKKSANLGVSARQEGRLLGENYAVIGDDAARTYGVVGADTQWAAIGSEDERLAAEMAASY